MGVNWCWVVLLCGTVLAHRHRHAGSRQQNQSRGVRSHQLGARALAPPTGWLEYPPTLACFTGRTCAGVRTGYCHHSLDSLAKRPWAAPTSITRCVEDKRPSHYVPYHWTNSSIRWVKSGHQAPRSVRIHPECFSLLDTNWFAEADCRLPAHCRPMLATKVTWSFTGAEHILCSANNLLPRRDEAWDDVEIIQPREDEDPCGLSRRVVRVGGVIQLVEKYCNIPLYEPATMSFKIYVTCLEESMQIHKLLFYETAPITQPLPYMMPIYTKSGANPNCSTVDAIFLNSSSALPPVRDLVTPYGTYLGSQTILIGYVHGLGMITDWMAQKPGVYPHYHEFQVQGLVGNETLRPHRILYLVPHNEYSFGWLSWVIGAVDYLINHLVSMAVTALEVVLKEIVSVLSGLDADYRVLESCVLVGAVILYTGNPWMAAVTILGYSALFGLRRPQEPVA